MPADVGIRHPNHFLGAGCAHLGEKLRHPKQRTANGHSKVETTAIPLHVNARCTASGEVEVCLNHTLRFSYTASKESRPIGPSWSEARQGGVGVKRVKRGRRMRCPYLSFVH